MYSYEIRLTLRNQPDVQGLARTTKTTADKREWLLLTIDNHLVEVDLAEIESMQAITVNGHFDRFDFL